ncbi:Oidioi.mRNA.OKI2018_I69.XSR.g14799.t1.cds [Oikopleura dioica]|uniref:Oidioi.mRNA.OKI2018_I69.XSR.g14799.t1.cds n=1 Tax=Oikopleura dioica TaxID=34765 RepID=A0ABN7SCM0_OIKDI|nr:Oidioi.mRNA.OKI2018_I69.XSR.g14799.t1.cds [Oikopleura dioica]
MVELQEKHEKEVEKFKASYSRALVEKSAVQAELDAVDKQVFELHARFGKLRGIVENVKRNEQALRNTVAEHEQRLLEEQERFGQLKDWSQKFVNQANETIAETEASVNHRLLALETENRRLKIKQESLTAELQRKSEEVSELTGICDELITSASANY